jgi:hypothetical protein
MRKLLKGTPLCACGCGKRVRCNKGSKQWNKFINGHNDRREKLPEVARGTFVPLCACGCGKKVKWSGLYKRWNKYINYHANKDPIYKAKLAILYNNPEWREEQRKNAIEQWESPELRKRMKAIWDDPKRNKAIGKRWNKFWSDPKNKENLSKKIKKKYEENIDYYLRLVGKNNPNWCENSISPYCDIWKTPEFKEMIRGRDNYKCQNPSCWKKIMKNEKLPIHHINYKKEECHPINLITLCRSCHGRSNANRSYWKKYYQTLMRGKFKKNGFANKRKLIKRKV